MGIPAPSTHSVDDGLDELRLWRRLHIRLSALYGGLTLLALTLLGIGTFRSAMDREVASLQQNLLATANSLALSIDGDAVAALPAEPSQPTVLHTKLLGRFRDVAQRDQGITSIYLLRSTRDPTRLRFVMDYVRRGIAGRPGEAYDASEVPVMLKGFNQPAVESQPTRDAFGTSLSGYAPVKSRRGESVAVLGVDVDAARIDQIREDVLWEVGRTFGITILLLGAVAGLVGRNLRAPLEQIMTATNAISQGDLNTRIGLRRGDELGLMSRHIDVMAGQLQEREFIRETFGRFLSTRIAAEVLSQGTDLALGGEERVVTVLFMDLRGYTTISEQLSPPQVVGILNTYLGAMNEIVERHQGCVIEFIGDAIFAVFGSPCYSPDHAIEAVRCGIAMQAALRDLNRAWQAEGIARLWQRNGIEALTARVGIHSGPVVVGNLGSRSRMKYSVIGDTVNIAARLEALTKDLQTDILISREVYIQLPEEMGGSIEERGRHQVKGREDLVTVYAVDWPSLAMEEPPEP
jgi:adenylate cyclase